MKWTIQPELELTAMICVVLELDLKLAKGHLLPFLNYRKVKEEMFLEAQGFVWYLVGDERSCGRVMDKY